MKNMTIRNFNNSFGTLNVDHRLGITRFLGKSDEWELVKTQWELWKL